MVMRHHETVQVKKIMLYIIDMQGMEADGQAKHDMQMMFWEGQKTAMEDVWRGLKHAQYDGGGMMLFATTGWPSNPDTTILVMDSHSWNKSEEDD